MYSKHCIYSITGILKPYCYRLMHGRPQGGARGSGRSPLENSKKKKKKKRFEKKNVQTKFFNLQKAPIVCYAKNFPHKRPPCYALNTQKGPHVMR